MVIEIIAGLVFGIWAYLMVARGGFWLGVGARRYGRRGAGGIASNLAGGGGRDSRAQRG